MILEEVHDGIDEEHYEGRENEQNIFYAELWWPTLHKDANENYHSCDAFQRVGNQSSRDEMPLNPHVTLLEFEKLFIDFVGTINPQEIRSG
jgi:hypothetical protein